MSDPALDEAPAADRPARRLGFLRNVSWTMMATGSRVVAVGLALLLLSRMVSPATMGVYGLGWAIASLGLALSQSGAAQGLIALKTVTPEHVTAARWLSLTVSVSLGLLVVLVAPIGEDFYQLKGLHQSLLLAAASIPLMSLSTVDVAMLQRSLEFRLISIVQSIAAICGGALAVLLGYLGHDLIALYSLQGLAGPISFVCFRLAGRNIGYSRCDPAHLRDLWRFGSHLSLGSLSGVIWLNAPQMLIGKMVGAEALGHFVFCQRIVQLVATQLGGVINMVIYPTFAALIDPREVGRAYLRAAPYTILVQAVPLLLLVSAPAGFLALYGGQQWVSAAEILRFLAVMQFGLLLGSSVFPTFQALGRPAVVWQWNLMLLTFQLGVIALTASGGILSVTQGLAASTLVMPLCAWWLMRAVKLPFRSYLATILPIGSAVVVASAAGLWVASRLAGSVPLQVVAGWCVSLTVLVSVFVAVDVDARTQLRRIFCHVLPTS